MTNEANALSGYRALTSWGPALSDTNKEEEDKEQDAAPRKVMESLKDIYSTFTNRVSQLIPENMTQSYEEIGRLSVKIQENNVYMAIVSANDLNGKDKAILHNVKLLLSEKDYAAFNKEYESIVKTRDAIKARLNSPEVFDFNPKFRGQRGLHMGECLKYEGALTPISSDLKAINNFLDKWSPRIELSILK